MRDVARLLFSAMLLGLAGVGIYYFLILLLYFWFYFSS
ncbi:hypothetical protein Lepil_2504 [Leptonema illini DSM 21528]|uniref:Uncharacterized protein n=1 Tax=Leptonema illini DSM 21528 TaxID=929563 RepID=H2CK76_9LEPT|nr:hypothetical protein Lepil_2504 [Leptonema illini DSM 21528]